MIVLLISFLLLYIGLRQYLISNEPTLGKPYLDSLSLVLSLGVFFYGLTAVTYSYSLLGILNEPVLRITWGLILLSLLVYTIKSKAYKQLLKPLENSTGNQLFYGGLALLFFSTLIKTDIYVYDSLTYHLPRVFHWAHNQSVAFYPAAVERQNYIQPLHEYVLLNSYLIDGTHIFFQSINFFLLLPLHVIVKAILEELHKRKVALWKAGLITLAHAPLLVEIGTTQTDVLATLSYCMTLYVVLFLPATTRLYFFLCPALFALAYFSKGVNAFYVAPLMVYFAYRFFQYFSRKAFISTLAGGLTGVALLSFFLYETLKKYGTLTANQTELYFNEGSYFFSMLSNAFRNFMVLIVPPIPEANTILHKALDRIYLAFGQDITDKTNTFLGYFSMGQGFAFGDSTSPSFFIACCILLSAAFLIFNRKNFTKGLALYLVSIVTGFLCYNLILKFQIWGSRLTIPFFIACVPLLIYTFERYTRFWRYVFYSLAGIYIALVVVNSKINPIKEPPPFSYKGPPLINKKLIMAIGGNSPEYYIWKAAQFQPEKIVATSSTEITSSYDYLVSKRKLKPSVQVPMDSVGSISEIFTVYKLKKADDQ